MPYIKFDPKDLKFKKTLKHILNNMLNSPPKTISKPYNTIMSLIKRYNKGA